MNYSLKNISYSDFDKGLNELMTQISVLLGGEYEDVDGFQIKANSLILETKNYIKNSIKPFEKILDILENKYGQYHTYGYDFSHYGIDKRTDFQKSIDNLKEFKYSFKLASGYLSTIEVLSNPNFSPITFTILEKNDFVLSKLNRVFGDENYSIEVILKLNNISYRDQESREIAEDLSKRGYLILKDTYGNSDKVKISVKGARYIERKISIKKNKKNDNLNKKLDDVLERLTKLGYGQEIIFEEIEELRNLQEKLSKKSWGQLLKGKLIDLALDKIISTEAAKIVYEYLTNGDFKLLGK